MSNLQDEELIAIVRERLEANRRVINDLRDMTGKLEATNRRLKESESLKGNFLSNIRNEINNPLAAIIGFAYHLKGGGVDGEQAAMNGRFIYDEAMELNFQLENVFAAAGLEAGVEMPEPVAIDAAAVLNEVIARLEFRRSGKEIEIRRGFQPHLPVVFDPRFLQIIISNLVANALEYTPAKSVVELSASVEGTLLRIDVSDQGPGIDSMDHETIFDRFRQLDRGRCKSHKGLGLGLSVSRALAELAGGEISVRSMLGAGSTFTMTAPLSVLAMDAETSEDNLLFEVM